MMRNGIITHRTRWNLLAVAAAFALGAGGCLIGDANEGSSELAAKTPKPDPGTGGTGGTGGQCADILVHGCDGATGTKLEQCKKDIQNAFDACVKAEHCQALRDEAAKDCGKDVACFEKADQIYNACIGPASQPGTQPPKPTPGK